MFIQSPTTHLETTTCITDWEQFRAFAKSHGDKTQVEMAQLWEGNISDAYGELR